MFNQIDISEINHSDEHVRRKEVNLILWKLFIHVIAGVAGYQIFTFQYPGILYLLAITIVIQAIDVFRIYHKYKELYYSKNVLYFFKLAQLYIWKVIFYGTVTLVSSFIMRRIMA